MLLEIIYDVFKALLQVAYLTISLPQLIFYCRFHVITHCLFLFSSLTEHLLHLVNLNHFVFKLTLDVG